MVKTKTLLTTLFALTLALPMKPVAAQEVFLGEVRLFGFNFCPRGWLPADGQLLSISPNTALFSLYGTTYGGDGRTSFALPDLRGRAPINRGQGAGLSSYPIGRKGGTEMVTLTAAQIPSHSHSLEEESLSQVQVRQANRENDRSISVAVPTNANNTTLQNTSNTGGSQAHNNMPPYLTMTWCVAVQGIFPSRS